MGFFNTRQQKAFLIVEFTSDMLFGEETIKELQPQLNALIEEDGHRKLILDLSKVREVSSRFLGLVVTLHTRLTRRSGKLVLCGLNGKLTELMALTRLDRMIPVVSSPRDAVERDVFLG